MLQKFVHTSSVRNFYAACDRLAERGAAEQSWLAVLAPPGLGKSRTVRVRAIEANEPYVRAKAQWTPRWMLQDIAEEFGLETTGSIKDLFSRIMARIAETQKTLTIDEARNTLHDVKLLETLRDLTDLTECPIILSGEDFVLKRLTTKHPQIRRRISQTVEFKPATFDDARLIYDEVCEREVSDDVVAEALRQSYGYFGELKETVVAVERIARLQGVDRVEAKHLTGRLCQDRHDVRARAVG